MGKQPVAEMERQPGENAEKDLQRNAARTRRMEGKRQRQQHDDRNGERIEHLGPQCDFIARGLLLVLPEMPDVAEQRRRGHLFGRNQQHAENVRAQHRLPVHRLAVADHDAALQKARVGNIAERPAVLALPAPALGRHDPRQFPVAAEFVDLEPAQAGVRQHLARIDEGIAVLHPQPGPESLRHDGFGGAQFQPLGRLLRPGRHQFAHQQRQQREPDPRQSQQRGDAPVRNAGSEHHRKLGIHHQPGQREQGADQGRDRHDLIHMPRYIERHVQGRLREAVIGAAYAAELPGQIEKGKQQDQADEHEARGHRHLPQQIAGDQVHLRRSPRVSGFMRMR